MGFCEVCQKNTWEVQFTVEVEAEESDEAIDKAVKLLGKRRMPKQFTQRAVLTGEHGG